MPFPFAILREMRVSRPDENSLAHALWPRSRSRLIIAITAKIPTSASARAHTLCFNHRFNAGISPCIYWRPGAAAAGACARIYSFFFLSLFFTTAYLRGLVTCRYYAGIHVPADRENCDYLQRLELFLAIRSCDSTLAQEQASVGKIPFVPIFSFFLPLFNEGIGNLVPRLD